MRRVAFHYDPVVYIYIDMQFCHHFYYLFGSVLLEWQSVVSCPLTLALVDVKGQNFTVTGRRRQASHFHDANGPRCSHAPFLMGPTDTINPN